MLNTETNLIYRRRRHRVGVFLMYISACILATVLPLELLAKIIVVSTLLMLSIITGFTALPECSNMLLINVITDLVCGVFCLVVSVVSTFALVTIAFHTGQVSDVFMAVTGIFYFGCIAWFGLIILEGIDSEVKYRYSI